MSRTVAEEAPVRARIPADLDAPDRIAFGLTVRQAAVLAATAAPLYVAWKQLAGRVPVPVLAAVTVPVAAAAAVVALGRRDGVPLDAWLEATAVLAAAADPYATGGTAPRTPPGAPVTGPHHHTLDDDPAGDPGADLDDRWDDRWDDGLGEDADDGAPS